MQLRSVLLTAHKAMNLNKAGPMMLAVYASTLVDTTLSTLHFALGSKNDYPPVYRCNLIIVIKTYDAAFCFLS